MNKRKLQLVAALIFVCVPCVTMAQFKVIGKHGEPTQRLNKTEMNTIVFVDHNLNRSILSKNKFTGKEYIHETIKVSINSAGTRTGPTGLLEVWAVLRNHTDYPLQVEGQTSFYDEQNAPIDVPPMWKRVYIPANSIATYKENATDFASSNFIVELREGR